jgi:hypothetical protein
MRNITVRRKRNRPRQQKPKSQSDLQPVQEVVAPLPFPKPEEQAAPEFPKSFDDSQRNITWPVAQNRKSGSSQGPDDSSSRRHSGFSNGSTVVEAIIISTPPRERRSLRHVSKTISLRSDAESTLGSPSTRSRTSSVDLDSATQRTSRYASDSQRRRRPSHSQSVASSSSGQGHRLKHSRDSYSLREEAEAALSPTNSSFSTPPSKGKQKAQLSVNGYTPSPIRKSAERALTVSPPLSFVTASSIRAMTKSPASLHSTRSMTQRALEGALSPVFAATQSASANDSVVTVIKKKSGASDAPAYGRPRSRPDSIRRSEPAQRTEECPPLPEQQLSPTLDGHLSVPGVTRRLSDAGSGRSLSRSTLGTRLSVDRSTIRSEDHPRNLFSQGTPFSQMSDMPDGLEVSEATAVSIFPHNNNSLLVVQQVGRPSRPGTNDENRLLLPPPAEHPLLTFQPSTPPDQQGEFGEPDVDSPLRNPRRPPQPPVIKVLPATPAHDEDNPLEAAGAERAIIEQPVRRLTLMQRARRYSDTLIARTTSIRRVDYSRRQDRIEPPRQTHLHPFWHPRDFWEHCSDSESDFGDPEDDDYGRLPPGGDTSEVVPEPKGLAKVLSLPAFKGTGGFLMGNSLGLERAGTNKRRPYISRPAGFRASDATDDEPRAIDYEDSRNGAVIFPRPSLNKLIKRRSSPNGLLKRKPSSSSLRGQSLDSTQRRMKRKWKTIGLQIEYIGIGGVRDLWRERRQLRKEKKAERRRDEIRRSIGPHVIVHDQAAAIFPEHKTSSSASTAVDEIASNSATNSEVTRVPASYAVDVRDQFWEGQGARR